MKRLSDNQKAAIQNFRAAGLGYKSIAEKLSLSRETVRSFCARNGIPAGTCVGADGRTADSSSNEMSSGIKIGNTVFVITTGYSEKASETLEKKLEKLILNDALKQSRCYQFVQESA